MSELNEALRALRERPFGSHPELIRFHAHQKPRHANHNIDAAELCRWANERLGKTQRLNAVELVAGLPRSPIGKVLKRELRDLVKCRP